MNEKTGIKEPIKPHASSGAQSADSAKPNPVGWLMMVCCIAMVLGIAGIFLLAPQDESWAAKITLVLPLLACVGTHVLLHRLTGRHSCSSSNTGTTNSDD